MLTKQRHLLPLASDRDTTSDIRFQQTPDVEGEFCHGFTMRLVDWEDMGSPEHITITIEPGDLLNDDQGA